jgi:predicted component of type VI protein secretion system
MALYLDPLNGGRQIVLDKAVVLIGRQSDCDVILDNSRKVSRRHCAIAQVNERYLIRDLESMNGVTVNGNRVKREAPLEVGDEISLGDMRYVLRDTNAAKAGPAVAKALVEPAAGSSAAPPPLRPPKPAVLPRPANISQKFATPIAEEGVDFAVEPSIQLPRSPLLSEEPGDFPKSQGSEPEPAEPIIELELVDPDAAPPETHGHDHDQQQLPDVIILDDSGEVDAARGTQRKRRK